MAVTDADNVLPAISRLADEKQDEVALRDWYAGKDAVDTQQSFLDAGSSLDADDFFLAKQSGLAAADRNAAMPDGMGELFQPGAEPQTNPGLSSWAIGSALLAFHLEGRGEASMGADVQAWSGREMAFLGLRADALKATEAGRGMQDVPRLSTFSGLQEGLTFLA
jgi:hypothetical protein